MRQERSKITEQKRQHDLQLAAAWKQQADAEMAKKKGDRQRMLSILRQASAKQKERVMIDNSDDEYEELVKKFGDKVRTPGPVSLFASTSARGSKTTRKPPVPSVSKSHVQGLPGLGVQVGTGVHHSGHMAHTGTSARASPRAAIAQRNVMASAASSSPSPLAKSGANLETTLTSVAPMTSAADSAHKSTPEPPHSLMPRKHRLRKIQQALLKETRVVFYKPHLRAQFQKILETVETNFNEPTKRQNQVARKSALAHTTVASLH